MGMGNAGRMGQGAGHWSSEVAQVMDVDHPIGAEQDISNDICLMQRDNANATHLAQVKCLLSPSTMPSLRMTELLITLYFPG